MNITFRILFVVMVSLALTTLTGCPKKSPPLLMKPPATVFLTNPPDFEPGPKGGADWIYVKEGANIRSYNKIMMEYVEFYLKDDTGYKGIDEREFKELANTFQKALVEALGKTYSLVSKPGPDVLRLRVAITNMIPSRLDEEKTEDVLSGGWSSKRRSGSIGKLFYMGEASIEVELLDSQTNERLAAAMDTKATEKQDFSVGKWELVEEVLKFWAQRLRRFLDLAHGKY
jgi:hypothetical protein